MIMYSSTIRVTKMSFVPKSARFGPLISTLVVFWKTYLWLI